MKYQLKHRLGIEAAKVCNDKFGASLSLKPDDLAIGEVVTLPEAAYGWLAESYASLLEPQVVKGEAKKPAITAPAK